MKKPIAYLKLNHVLLCSAIGFTSLNAMAESTNNAINETLSVLRTNQGNLTIKGTISDKTGPIIGANVIIKGTTNGVITDIDGNFTLENVKKGDILQVSFIGYSTKEIKISNNNNLHIQLDEDTQSLEEVVVVGYGSQRKSDLTGGVTAVGEDKLGLVSTNNLMDKLAGQIPGLNISTGNAQPGEDQTLRIRGNNSLTASNDPLIVMDGIPYSGSLGDIDPDIIESMSVLKDASSAAIYGSRGSNGVILIQTKKGRQGKATVTYKGQVGMAETERRLDMMSGDEYLQYLYDYNHLKNGIPYDQLTPESVLGADELANYKAGRTIDWQDKMFRQALVTNHQISLTGGTESTTYMASISRLRQDGVVRNTGMKRTNISLNINQNLGKWLKIGMSMQAIQKEYGGELPYLEAGLKMSPFGTYSDEEGNLEYYPMSRNTLFYNPMSDCDAIEDKTNRNVFISTFADITLPVKGLSFRTNFGYNYRNNFVGTYYGRNTLTGSKVDGAASIENTHYWDYTWENILKP